MLWLTFAATFLGASIQSFTGFGFSLIAAPVFFAVYSPPEAVTIMLTLGTTICVLVLTAESRGPDVAWSASVRLALGVLPGVLVGGLILRSVSEDALEIAVGLTIIAGALTQAMRRGSPRGRGSLRGAYPVGLVGGVLGTATTVGGPVIFLWMRRLGLEGHQLRDSLAVVFIVANLAGIASVFVLADAWAGVSPRLLIYVAVGVFGHFVGSRLFHRSDPATVLTVGLGVSLAAGATSVVHGAVA